MDKIIESLAKIWMSETEIKVYMSILRNPRINISKISRKSLVKRTTVYWYLEKLLNKWFIKKSIKWKIILYVSEKPDNILKTFEEKKKTLTETIPILKDIYDNLNTSTKVETFEWKSEIKKYYRKTLESTTSTYTFFSPKKFYKIFSKEFTTLHNSIRKKNEIKLYDLVENNKEWEEYLKNIDHYWKILPKWFFDIWIDLMIFEDYVLIISFDSMNWLLIKDKAINRLFKSIYLYIWGTIK